MSSESQEQFKQVNGGWFSELPIDWAFVNCRAIVDHINLKNDGATNENYLSLMANVGVIPYEEKGEVGNKKPEDLSKCKLVRKGNLVINSMNYSIGSYGMSDYDGVCSPVYVVLNPKVGVVLPRYALRIFENKVFQNYASSFGNGILAHRAAIGWGEIKNIKVGIPSIEVQQKIVDFLDYETAKINELIHKQEKMVDLIDEKITSVTDSLVTKGLDKSIPLKKTKFQTLGSVPSHWDVLQIKRLVSTRVTDGPHETPDFVDEGVPFVSAEAVSKGFIDFEKIRGFISPDVNRVYSKKYSPQIHDIYMVKSGATTGVTAIVEDRTDFNIWSPLAVIRCSEKMNPYYALYAMRSKYFQEMVSLSWSFGTQQNIGMGVIENLCLPVPPRVEQDAIVKKIDSLLNGLKELKDKAITGIDLLKEHRTSLISAAVTGKIDVRELVKR